MRRIVSADRAPSPRIASGLLGSVIASSLDERDHSNPTGSWPVRVGRLRLGPGWGIIGVSPTDRGAAGVVQWQNISFPS